MASSDYSFIDIAVMDEVRSRFAAGDALAILSADIGEVIWANGPGAKLFGYPDIEAIMGAETGLTIAQRRQIAATPGFPEIGRDRPLAIRLSSGSTSRAVTFLATGLHLPDGELAILLAAPAPTAAARDPEAVQRRAISGFTEAGYFAALLDEDGTVLAAAPGFGTLEIAPATLSNLASEVADEQDRLVKRRVAARSGNIPAGIARLTDAPALHLLIAVDEAEPLAGDPPIAEKPQPAGAPETGPDTPAEPAGSDDGHGDLFDRGDGAGPIDPATAPHATPLADGGSVSANGRGQVDRWYFDADRPARSQDGTGESPETDTPENPEPPRGADDDGAPDVSPLESNALLETLQTSGPLRFVWRTDADGRISMVAEEFAKAVRMPVDTIVGRSFVELTARHGLDPDGEIAGLLARRDTWSGKTVLWPVDGTELHIPVDLAALPIYGRERQFEGFRGFGIARMADAAVDPQARGFARSDEVPEQSRTLPSALPQDNADQPAGGADADELTPDRQEKIVLLETRRAGPAARALSSTEHDAFREIGDRLKDVTSEREAGEADEDNALAETRRPADNDDRKTADERRGVENTHADPEPAAAAHDGGTTASGPRAPTVSTTETETVGETPPGDIETPLAGMGSPEAAHRETGPSDGATREAGIGRPTDDGTDEAEKTPAGAEETASGDPAPSGAETSAAPDSTSPDEKPARTAPIETAVVAGGEPAHGSNAFVLPSAFAAAGASGYGRQFGVSVFAKLPIALLVHSGDVLHFGNPAFWQMTGYASLDDLDEAGGLGALFVEPYETLDGDNDGAAMLRTKDGREFPVRAHLQSVPWRERKALLLAVTPLEQPTGQRPDSEIALSDARVAEMGTILDTATDGIVLIDDDGTIRSLNHPAEALFGYDAAEMTGKPFVSLFAVESQKAARDYLQGLSDNGVASVLNDGREVIGREAQGRFIPLFMTIGRLPAGGFCAVMRDITQWKRAEEELTKARALAETASSQKTDFLARVSHEIRTPLNAIIGFSELILDEKFGPIGNERYRDYLRDINRSGNHVLDLVNDLLDISKIEAGEQELSYEAVPLNETLAEIVAMMQPQANRERVIIRSSYPSRLPDIVADLRSIRQIALNLLSNAVRFTPPGGQVIVSTAYEATGDVVMRVRDTGVGMSRAEIEQALKPFKQINSLKRKRSDGTGLGLPLTKAMVEANRASFSIHSTPGEGTLVEVSFPSTRVLAD
ncbi:PAS domain S-box protein [Nitratireductor sp. CAU 1489]|uniref:histidine kinase n=1 Tax=Nitratireductor arenosus TaxID=2682096 RepID=A0A844QJQ3_9HYPH|nr:PAS domain S-box protein [Nitratireductor arenosus]MVA99457.1 PAS domain S-box protein [Nitratireductor arenosus]